MTVLALSRVHFPVTTLGPGRRLGIWFQGCSIRCQGCISADTWNPRTGRTTVDGLIRAVTPWLREAEGVTISGGEPFDQPAALAALLKTVRAHTAVDVLVYSGHPFERLQPWLRDFPGLIDALISEPYVASAPQTRALRGSDNQVLHLLSSVGILRFKHFESAAPDHRFDLMLDDAGTVWLAGIPARKDFARLRAALEGAGHMVRMSDVVDAEAAD